MGRPKSDNKRNIRVVFMVNEDENGFIEGVAEGLELSKPNTLRLFLSFLSNIDPEKILNYSERVELITETEKISTFDLSVKHKLEKKEMAEKEITEKIEKEEINGLDDVTRRFEKIEKDIDNIKYVIDNNSESIVEIVEVVDDIIKGHNKLYGTFKSHSHLLGNIVAEIDDNDDEYSDEDDEDEEEEEIK